MLIFVWHTPFDSVTLKPLCVSTTPIVSQLAPITQVSMAAPSHQKAPPRMEVQHALIDKDFDRYVLASGCDRQFVTLPVRALEPLAPTHTVRKAQWDARARFNALTADPFVSGVAYFVSADYALMQVVCSEVRSGCRLL